MRINKLFSNYGICSRKETNNLIKDKRILVNNILAFEGQWVEESDFILFDNMPLKKEPPIYLAFNKPRGILCSSDLDLENNIITFINYPKYIFPIGRLDKESEGLIILTNDGDFANSLINAENNHEKEYIVTVNKPFTDDFLVSMAKGVQILNTTTRPCILNRVSEDTFKITLTQGLNRQIRRMCLSFGFKVIFLKRIRILNLELENLDEGAIKTISPSTLETLKNLLKK